MNVWSDQTSGTYSTFIGGALAGGPNLFPYATPSCAHQVGSLTVNNNYTSSLALFVSLMDIRQAYDYSFILLMLHLVTDPNGCRGSSCTLSVNCSWYAMFSLAGPVFDFLIPQRQEREISYPVTFFREDTCTLGKTADILISVNSMSDYIQHKEFRGRCLSDLAWWTATPVLYM